VTGATGFVGAAVARALANRGHTLRTLVRPTSDRRNLEEFPHEICVGDLRDPKSLSACVAGCSHVFHVAAEYRLWRPDPAVFYEINVEGSRNLLCAAADAGVERLIYTSSVATLGLPGDGRPGDEATPVCLEDMIGHYKRSKFLAEETVRELASERNLNVVIVNPSTPIGPRDIKPTPTGRTVLDAAAGKTPAYVDTGLNVVHVDDVANGHLLALEHGRRGERYVLGGEDMSLRDILVGIAEITGGKPPHVRLSPNLLMPLAHIAQAWARLRRGDEPRLTVDGLRMSKKRMFFSSAKAERELGYRHRPAKEALRDAITWFRENGYWNPTGARPRQTEPTLR